MNRLKRWLTCGLFLLPTWSLFAQAEPAIPHLEKRGGATQLQADGKAFLILGGELFNSSSSSLVYMQPIWGKLAAMHLNTMLAPVSWELLEPQERQFDFSLVDGLIAGARGHELRLVFLWFGSWKNTFSSYVPEWVKRDTKRFPRVLPRDGRPTERLSPFSEANRQADAQAFAALMQHIRQVDSAQTVIMVQVENEVGVIPESRDFSEAANAAFAAPVPKHLMEYLQDHGDTISAELRAAWVGSGQKPGGSWQEVFGKAPLTDDLFMAWQYAAYIDAVAAAGKSEYPIPMFANAALIRPNYQPGQYNSGGPLPHSMDIYRAGAPHLDFLSPDIYFDDFAAWAGRYRRPENPVFVPEARGGSGGAANALYTIGQLDGIGFSPFGIDGNMSMPASEKIETVQYSISTAYAAISHLAPLILAKQGTGEMRTVLLEGEAQPSGRMSLGGYGIAVVRGRPVGPDMPERQRVAVMFIHTGPDEFLVMGSGPAQVSFSNTEGAATAGIASIDEEVLNDGKWTVLRRLNGDEDSQGQALKVMPEGNEKPTVYKVRLYRY